MVCSQTKAFICAWVCTQLINNHHALLGVWLWSVSAHYLFCRKLKHRGALSAWFLPRAPCSLQQYNKSCARQTISKAWRAFVHTRTYLYNETARDGQRWLSTQHGSRLREKVKFVTPGLHCASTSCCVRAHTFLYENTALIALSLCFYLWIWLKTGTGWEIQYIYISTLVQFKFTKKMCLGIFDINFSTEIMYFLFLVSIVALGTSSHVHKGLNVLSFIGCTPFLKNHCFSHALMAHTKQ